MYICRYIYIYTCIYILYVTYKCICIYHIHNIGIKAKRPAAVAASQRHEMLQTRHNKDCT